MWKAGKLITVWAGTVDFYFGLGVEGMARVNKEVVEEFVTPLYEGKDSAHGLGHIGRMLREAEKLRVRHGGDAEVVMLAGHFHGLIREHRPELEDFLEQHVGSKRKREKILRVAEESLADTKARSTEGKVLHDAHLVEGGEDSLVSRTLATGIARGQSARESLEFLEQEVLGKRSCYFTECQQRYARKEAYARQALGKLKGVL